MKTISLIFLFTFLFLTVQSQDYLITFTAKGDTNQVSTVIVHNLNNSDQRILTGNDTLHLIEAVGLPSGEISSDRIRLIPNPMTRESLLTCMLPKSGLTTILIVDMTGKTVARFQEHLPAGSCCSRITGIGNGIYAVYVSGDGYAYHTKLISSGAGKQLPGITLLSSGQDLAAGHLKTVSQIITMPYHDGDRLLFTGTAGNYSNVVTDIPSSSGTIQFTFTVCTDAENKHYPTVIIGSQTWMAANLNVGSRINGAQNQSDNGIIEKYCYLDDDDACDIHGGLYQWNELMQYVTTPGVHGLCPAGWHIPTDGEWCTMTQYLDPAVNCNATGWSGVNAGGKLKSTGTLEAGTGLWYQPNAGATNEAGFSGLPSGDRSENASFAYQGNYAFWWSSTELDTGNAWSRSPDYSVSKIVRGGNQKICGFSVRCIHD